MQPNGEKKREGQGTLAMANYVAAEAVSLCDFLFACHPKILFLTKASISEKWEGDRGRKFVIKLEPNRKAGKGDV